MKFLLLNQTFYPDVASTGQYLADLAIGLAARGHEVTVVTSRRAYDHPEQSFPKQETWRGICIHRVGSTGFGKNARWRRAADFASFLLLCCLRLLTLPRHDVIVALTTPPLISFAGAWLARLKRSRFIYWVMDFNPDEAVAAGWLRADSLLGKTLEAMSRFSLRRAHRIIALDRFMRDRIVAKGIGAGEIAVIPPWSHDDHVRYDPEGRARFRKAHGLEGKFVVMYSGNHSPVHPLATLLGAARRLADQPDIVFCFVGGGSEWRKIKAKTESGKRKAESGDEKSGNGNPRTEIEPGLAQESSNILCLPYQPLSELSGSLSAADLHVVVMGEPFVGLVHPCKIYNILNVAAPVLYIGPRPSHLSEILEGLQSEHPCALATHGDVEAVVSAIRRLGHETPATSRRVPAAAHARFSQSALLPRLIAELESQ